LVDDDIDFSISNEKPPWLHPHHRPGRLGAGRASAWVFRILYI